MSSGFTIASMFMFEVFHVKHIYPGRKIECELNNYKHLKKLFKDYSFHTQFYIFVDRYFFII